MKLRFTNGAHSASSIASRSRVAHSAFTAGVSFGRFASEAVRLLIAETFAFA